MVGGLQSNKINEATSLFTCIHSVDRKKILEGINKSLTKILYSKMFLFR